MDIHNIADQGVVFTSDKDRNIFNRIDVGSLYESNFNVLTQPVTKEQVKKAFMESGQQLLVVKSMKGRLDGVIYFEDVRQHLLSASEIEISHYISKIYGTDISDVAYKMIQLMEIEHREHILVFNKEVLIGYVSKVSIMESYRKNLNRLRVE